MLHFFMTYRFFKRYFVCKCINPTVRAKSQPMNCYIIKILLDRLFQPNSSFRYKCESIDFRTSARFVAKAKQGWQSHECRIIFKHMYRTIFFDAGGVKVILKICRMCKVTLYAHWIENVFLWVSTPTLLLRRISMYYWKFYFIDVYQKLFF